MSYCPFLCFPNSRFSRRSPRSWGLCTPSLLIKLTFSTVVSYQLLSQPCCSFLLNNVMTVVHLASRSPAIQRSIHLITKSYSLGRGCSQYSRDDHPKPSFCQPHYHTTTDRVKATSSPFLYIELHYILLTCLSTSSAMKSSISRSQVLEPKSVSKK